MSQPESGQVTNYQMKYKVIEDFLTPAECEHIIKKYIPRVSSSTSPVWDGTQMVAQKTNAVCNTDVTWINNVVEPDEVIEGIIKRIVAETGVGREYYEPIQLLRYVQGQYYKLHLDNSYDDNPRRITFQIYLSDVAKGGETIFPCLNLAFRPKRGRAVVWWNFLDDEEAHRKAVSKNTADPDTLHEGATIEDGVKYSMTQWIKLRPIGEPARPPKNEMTVI